MPLHEFTHERLARSVRVHVRGVHEVAAGSSKALEDLSRLLLGRAGGGSPLERFRDQVIRGASWIQSPDGKVATRLIGDVQDDGKLHQLFLERFYLPRRSIYVNLMKEAIAAGELRPGTNIDLLIDVLHGPIYFRAILGHAAPDRAFVTELVDQVLPAFTS